MAGPLLNYGGAAVATQRARHCNLGRAPLLAADYFFAHFQTSKTREVLRNLRAGRALRYPKFPIRGSWRGFCGEPVGALRPLLVLKTQIFRHFARVCFVKKISILADTNKWECRPVNVIWQSGPSPVETKPRRCLDLWMRCGIYLSGENMSLCMTDEADSDVLRWLQLVSDSCRGGFCRDVIMSLFPWYRSTKGSCVRKQLIKCLPLD